MERPQQVGRYRLEREIARGGVGAVWLARAPGGEPVALKLLLAGRGASALQRRRVGNEIQALLRLRHPHVVQLLDAGESQGVPFLVMEWVEGETLGARLRREGPLAPDAALVLVGSLARALAHCHAQGVLHRDLKPENVLLRAADGQPLLTDFGLSKDLASEALPGGTATQARSVDGRWLGTPGYWPPEQAAGDLAAIGPRSDVYGLGALLYAALTARPPQEGDSLPSLLDATQRPVAPPSRHRPGLPPWLDAVCLRALATAPADRPASAADFADELARGTRAPARAAGGTPIWLALAGALLLVGVLVAGALLLARAPAPAAPTPAPPAGPSVDELLRAAGERERAGDLRGARALLDQALAIDPHHARALVARSRNYRYQGDQVGARVDLENALALHPDDAEAHCDLGILRSELHDLEGALTSLNRAIELAPGLALAWHNRGVVHQRREEPDLARADYARALELDPTLADAWCGRGTLALNAGDLIAARRDLDRAIELAPGYARAFRNRARVRELSRDASGALADYDRALELDPRDPGAWCDRAALRCDLRQVVAARGDYERAIALDPGNPEPICGRAWTLEQEGRLAEALADYERCLELAPRHPAAETVRDQIARIRAQLGLPPP